ncbi:MAG TPA: dTMP kinase [Candidatus Saccharimonadales bacterium]|nr:dTMP kinase [Candidatus Saccharimonadales bacterium]
MALTKAEYTEIKMRYHVELDIDFQRNTLGGKYIAIEGIDGSGKSTQVLHVQDYFTKQGKEVLLTSEPHHGSMVEKMIRDALQSKITIPSAALQYLYSADRVINQESIVKPSLSQEKIVLSHRVFWSAVPYGLLDKIMGLKGGDYDFNQSSQIMIAQGLLSMYHQFVVPDVTFYLDISVDTAMERLSHMDKTKEIYEKRDKLEKIREGYNLLINMFPKEFVVIDGEQSEKQVTEDILRKL